MQPLPAPGLQATQLPARQESVRATPAAESTSRSRRLPGQVTDLRDAFE
jgi:hypothetical protein